MTITGVSSTAGGCARALGLFMLTALLCLEACGADLKLEAQLIWGTNEPKSPNPKHKPVDAETAKKLQKIFKWKNYFVINRVVKTVSSRSSNQFLLSKKCTIDVKEMEGPRVEVKLIGEGKEVHKAVKNLTKGEWFTYAGDDKNDTAWFVIIQQLD